MLWPSWPTGTKLPSQVGPGLPCASRVVNKKRRSCVPDLQQSRFFFVAKTRTHYVPIPPCYSDRIFYLLVTPYSNLSSIDCCLMVNVPLCFCSASVVMVEVVRGCMLSNRLERVEITGAPACEGSLANLCHRRARIGCGPHHPR